MHEPESSARGPKAAHEAWQPDHRVRGLGLAALVRGSVPYRCCQMEGESTSRPQSRSCRESQKRPVGRLRRHCRRGWLICGVRAARRTRILSNCCFRGFRAQKGDARRRCSTGSSTRIFAHSVVANWCLEFRSKAWRASPTTATTSGRCACVAKERFPWCSRDWCMYAAVSTRMRTGF
jgi:hypothetical protein